MGECFHFTHIFLCNLFLTVVFYGKYGNIANKILNFNFLCLVNGIIPFWGFCLKLLKQADGVTLPNEYLKII